MCTDFKLAFPFDDSVPVDIVLNRMYAYELT